MAFASQHHPHTPHIFREKRCHCREPSWAPQIPSTSARSPLLTSGLRPRFQPCCHHGRGDRMQEARQPEQMGSVSDKEGQTRGDWEVLDGQPPTSVSHPYRWSVVSGRQSGGAGRSCMPKPRPGTAHIAHTTSPPRPCHRTTKLPHKHPLHDSTSVPLTPRAHPPHTRPTRCTTGDLQGEWAQEWGTTARVGSEEQGRGQETAWSKGLPWPGFRGAEATPRARGMTSGRGTRAPHPPRAHMLCTLLDIREGTQGALR